jgi:hypothetical protein
MGRAVNLVVSCSNRKRYETAPGLAAHKLAGSDVERRLKTWKERLETVQAQKYPAQELYMGEHWSVARDIPPEAKSQGWEVRLWICSAGYGLIQPGTRIKSYQATFAAGTRDYVVPGARDNGAAQEWWTGACSYTFLGERSFPRSFAALALAYPRTPLIVALSADYLNAVEHDLLKVLEHRFFHRYLSIISCGLRINHRCWKHNRLPCDGRLSAALGGTLTSLNARVARFLFSLPADSEPTVDHWSAKLGLIEGQTRVSQSREPQSDVEVARFIESRLKTSPLASKTRLIEEFRAAGRACEQKRFGELYKRLRCGAQRELHG